MKTVKSLKEFNLAMSQVKAALAARGLKGPELRLALQRAEQMITIEASYSLAQINAEVRAEARKAATN